MPFQPLSYRPRPAERLGSAASRLAPTRYVAPAGAHGPAAPRRVCPECAGRLVPASACVTCPGCGWSRCG